MISLSSSRHLIRISCLLGCFMVGLAACQQHDKQQVSYPDASDVDDQSTVVKAKAGDASAQAKLGWMYSTGNSAPKDVNKGIAWYTIAGNNGDHNAQYNLGVIYGNGQGVPKDYKKSAYWYLKAAEQGDREAQYSIGTMYYKGQGVPKDKHTAMQWYQRAADQGFPLAQWNMGISYSKGEDVVQDDQKAVYWFRKAADGGNVSAMAGLSEMYQHGRGVKRDYISAYRWLALELSIVEANPDSQYTDYDALAKDKRNYALLSKQLTSAQLQEADDWVKEWFAAHSK